MRPLRSSQEANPASSPHQVFSQLLDGLHRNLRFDHLGLGLLNSTTNAVEFVLQAGEEQMPSVRVLPDSLGMVIRDQQAIEIEDVELESRFPDLLERAKSNGFRSIRVVPFRTDQQTLGVICLLRRGPGRFSEEDVRHLDHIAQLAALSVQNAAMADILRREKSCLETLRDVNAALGSGLNLHKILQEVSQLIWKIVNQDYTHLVIYDPGREATRFYVLESGERTPLFVPESFIPLAESPAGISCQRKNVMQFGYDDLLLINSDYTRSLLESGIRSVSAFPLISRGRVLGALGLATKIGRRPSDEDMALLAQIATQVSLAIDNARAYEEIASLKDRLAKEKLCLEEEIQFHHNFSEIVGDSSALRQVLRQVEICAPSDATVLVQGETGTGKELIARAVHRLSTRRDESFIKVNCAAIPTGLLESELFGHEKGAFTGAVSQKVGRLELADKGTLFLDEIGEIPLELQPKLLRVLQDQEFERLGGIRTIKVNVRVIAATNRDLAQAVQDRQFRRDLYYRLNVFPVFVPPLRERAGDIPPLVRHFVKKCALRMGKNIDSIPTGFMQEFEQWSWPGNVRELENFIERCVILTDGMVLFAPMADLRIPLQDCHPVGTLEDVERAYILRTLREVGGVIAGMRGAAVRLGMKRTTLQSRMQKLGITREEYET